MIKNILKKYSPSYEKIKEYRILKIFGTALHKPALWSLNRRTASGAVSIGLFCAFLPIPMQMVVAAAFAILFRVNLPLSMAMVWITNPLTMPFFFYFTYKVGVLVLQYPEYTFYGEISTAIIANHFALIGPPLIVGSLLISCILALVGYFSIHFLWLYSTSKAWLRRKR